MKVLLTFLIVLSCLSSAFGQLKLEKVFSPDNSTIPKVVIQKRAIAKYYDGGAFRCGSYGLSDECNYEKLRQVISQCWNGKMLCYVTISWSGVDASRDEYIFIEPNKANKWLIVRRVEKYHYMPELRKPLHDLPLAYSVVWKEKNGEKILLLKNKLGKVIDEY